VGAKVATYTTLVNPHTNYTLVLAPIAEGVLGVSKSASFWGSGQYKAGHVAMAVLFLADVVGLTGTLFSF
jgi:hypothetical protein